MMAEIVHFNSTGIKVKIRASVLFRYAAQKALRLRKVIIFGVAHGDGACVEPVSRVMMA